MAETVDELAKEMKISRREQDAWAERSQRLYAMALVADVYKDEIVPVGECRQDEHPRPQVDRTSLAALRPAFSHDGTVTAGNASGINDGAAMLLLADEATVLKHGWPVMAEFMAGTSVGCDPEKMGLGPVHAICKLLNITGQSLGEFDTLEINEAFAVQVLGCARELSLDLKKLNRRGGGIALGHPIGCSGARIVVTLLHLMEDLDLHRGIAALCVGGGMGVAVALER